jgi:penicillin-binding protein 1A
VWIGLDQKKPLGNNMTGSDAALPVWIDLMKAWIGERKDAPRFEPPGNIVFVAVDRASGGMTEEGAVGAISEAFIAGTQPGSMRQ